MAHADTDLTNPPPVRNGCLGLLINYADAVLMVRPTYKDDGLYQLPGGGARENEPPWEAGDTSRGTGRNWPARSAPSTVGPRLDIGQAGEKHRGRCKLRLLVRARTRPHGRHPA
ncbi:NUDIX hydrolase [Streptomyces reniochalinae]|uniref:NUDIX hydrolase n=1 Tax=Streptomyces reniochalinae TaxID=2250578 RepID=UPI0011C06483|nr:NUDIX hydrolase [Streptomyces reniochalinae]